MNLKIFTIAMLVWPAVLHAQQTDSTAKNWTGTVAAYEYLIQQEAIHPTIIGCADFKSLHLESRFNYEDINTVSAFAGWMWKKDGKLSLSATPMIGMAVGKSNGILPGLECSVSFSKINFYSENEYMLSFKGKTDYFFYSWTQLSTTIFKNFQSGVLAQSLRWFKTKFDVQRGVYAEYALHNFTFDIYYFNAFTSSHFTEASITYAF